MKKNSEKKTKNQNRSVKGSIKTQLSLVMTLILAIPLVFVIVISTIMTRKNTIEDINAFNKVKAEAIEYEIASVLDQNMQSLQAFAAAPSTVVYITDANGQTESGTDLTASVLNQMKAIDAAMGDGNTTIISGNQGKQILRTNGDLLDISEREYYQKAMEGTLYVSDVEVSKATGNLMTTFAVPVYGEDGSVVGVVSRNYELSGFHDLLAEEVFEDQHEIVIVDRNGDVLAHSSHLVDASNPESQAQNPFYTDSRGDTLEGSYESVWQGVTWMISWVKEPKTGWVVASCRVQDVALADANRTTFVMLLIGVVALVAAVIVALAFSNRIAKPIQSVASSVKGLTSGNLTTKFDLSAAKRNDEIGQIASNSIALAEKLRDVIGRSKEMAGGLKKSGIELSGTSSQASMASGQVSEAVEEVSKGAISQAESVQDAAMQMETIGDGVEEIAENTNELHEASNNMEQNCNDAMASLRTLIEQSEKVSSSVVSIGDTIERTNEGANEISQFTEAINSIATQTNLLSLNASIEAARAGEAGKGFAVVADEISNLAAQSKESSDKINEIVSRLMQDAASSVEVMNTLRKNFDEQGVQLDATKECMENMANGISAVSDSAGNISQKVTDLRSAKDHLGGIIDDLSAISEENAASTEETNASMEELNATFNVISDSAGDLEKSAEELDDMIGFFTLDEEES